MSFCYVSSQVDRYLDSIDDAEHEWEVRAEAISDEIDYLEKVTAKRFLDEWQSTLAFMPVDISSDILDFPDVDSMIATVDEALQEVDQTNVKVMFDTLVGVLMNKYELI